MIAKPSETIIEMQIIAASKWLNLNLGQYIYLSLVLKKGFVKLLKTTWSISSKTSEL